jgi:hypothetical protein
MQAALGRRRWWSRLAADQHDWRGFARIIWASLDSLARMERQPATNEPPPATIIALRLIWGAERFAELPTVALKPPPASFLQKLTNLPAPARRSAPEAFERALAVWLAQQPPLSQGGLRLPVAEVRGFARIVAACRVVGQLRGAPELEDAAAGYLAWARLLRVDLQRLTDISSGWWSPNDRQLGRHPRG